MEAIPPLGHKDSVQPEDTGLGTQNATGQDSGPQGPGDLEPSRPGPGGSQAPTPTPRLPTCQVARSASSPPLPPIRPQPVHAPTSAPRFPPPPRHKGRQGAARTQTRKREGAAGSPEGGRKLQQGQARGPGGCCRAVVSEGSPRLPPNCRAEAKGAMPAPREASYQAASVTAHQGCQPPPASCPWLMLAPGCALDVSPPPPSSLKGAVCPQTAQILSPRHQRKCGCQGTPPAVQPCLQDKAPGPGEERPASSMPGDAGLEGAPGHGSGWGPTSRAPGPALRLWQGRLWPGWAPTQGVTSACSSLLPAWVSQRPGHPKTRADLPSSRQGTVLSRRGCHRMGPAPLTKLKGPPQGWRAGPPKLGPAQVTSAPGPVFSSVTGGSAPALSRSG